MKLHVCPNCDALWSAELSADPSRGVVTWKGRTVDLERRQAIILRALLDRPRSVASLVDVVWGDDPSGGPDDVANHLQVAVSRLRTALKQAGVPVRIIGKRYIGYFIEWETVNVTEPVDEVVA